jgi:ubiquinone/menaquinone biosynthesis C-methylase UbiE
MLSVNKKKNGYILEGERNQRAAEQEYNRLDFQNSLNQHGIGSLISQKDFSFMKDGARILDLGFGGGFMSKWLFQNVPLRLNINAIDNYKELAEYGLNSFSENQRELIKYSNDDFRILDTIDDNSQDLAITRYTAQHIPHELDSYFSAVYKKLRPGGKFIIIDGDGLSSNLKTGDASFDKTIIDLTNSFENYSPMISPKIHRELLSSGFHLNDEGIRNEVRIFSSKEDLEEVKRVWEMRFPLINKHLLNYYENNQVEVDNYIDKYLKGIIKEGQMMYLVMFCFVASKPLAN